MASIRFISKKNPGMNAKDTPYKVEVSGFLQEDPPCLKDIEPAVPMPMMNVLPVTSIELSKMLEHSNLSPASFPKPPGLCVPSAEFQKQLSGTDSTGTGSAGALSGDLAEASSESSAEEAADDIDAFSDCNSDFAQEIAAYGIESGVLGEAYDGVQLDTYSGFMMGAAQNLQGSLQPSSAVGSVLRNQMLQCAEEKFDKPNAWANVTTVMMRNLPNRLSQAALLQAVNDAGFLHTYDFLYLPIDPRTHTNRGYAFVNFLDSSSSLMFKAKFDGWRLENSKSEKVVVVVPAKVQGFEANYKHYSKSRSNHLSPSERPLFLGEPKFRRSQRQKVSLIDIAAAAATTTEMRPKSNSSKGSFPVQKSENVRAPVSCGQSCGQCKGPLQKSHKFCSYCGFRVRL